MADVKNTIQDENFIERVRELSQHVESGNAAEADRVLDQIAKLRESSLFQELGKLTREFHDALNAFRLDARLASYAEKDFPDARERLRHVVEMTARSADRSLTAAEESMPICDAIENEADELKGEWQRFVSREMSAAEFRALSSRLQEFLDNTGGSAAQLRTNINEVMMAQDFQDLTGQIIERVITLVDDMEGSLVELIRISGQNLVPDDGKSAEVDLLTGTGPVVPGVDDKSGNVVSGQDEVDDLLSSLGF
ncbi:MAG: protein phosphatase CheZ [Chromatiales bacterium]|nr:protein phosphatase CheZ [Chromatiales bacterium]